MGKVDDQTTIAELKKRFIQFRDERDWKKFHNPKDLAVSISIEANELLELFQWKDNAEVEEMLKNPKKMQEIRDELADIVTYCLSASDTLNIDLSEAVTQKLAKSAIKYPVEKAKGNAKKYNEL